MCAKEITTTTTCLFFFGVLFAFKT